MTDRHDITLTINGAASRITVEARKTLADAIREDCGLTGTHIGCEHGVCGACTVLLDGQPVRSCLMFAVQASGRTIRTVEGLAKGDLLHPLQQAFMEHHGLQCGFCTPGFLMLAAGALEANPDLGEDELVARRQHLPRQLPHVLRRRHEDDPRSQIRALPADLAATVRRARTGVNRRLCRGKAPRAHASGPRAPSGPRSWLADRAADRASVGGETS